MEGQSPADYLSLGEVAGYFGVSERTAYRWIKAGKLKAYKPGQSYRIPQSAVREFMEESEVAPKGRSRSPFEPSFNDALAEERRSETVTVEVGKLYEVLRRVWEQEQEPYYALMELGAI